MAGSGARVYLDATQRADTHRAQDGRPRGVRQARRADSNNEMVMDIIRVWWECHGMPTIIQDRPTARLVRRMLRSDWAAGAGVPR